MTISAVESICTNCADELVNEKYIQTKEEIKRTAHLKSSNATMFSVLEYLKNKIPY